MKVLQNIERKSKYYNLTCVELNNNTLRIYRPNMLYDSWLVIHEKDSPYIMLKHKCKVGKINSCKEYYHIQKKIRVENWIWVLQRISSHYKYKTGTQRQNLVDKILGQYNKERKLEI